jgi:hypothetical protein
LCLLSCLDLKKSCKHFNLDCKNLKMRGYRQNIQLLVVSVCKKQSVRSRKRCDMTQKATCDEKRCESTTHRTHRTHRMMTTTKIIPAWSKRCDEDGIRTRAPEEIGALIRRLRPTRPPRHALAKRTLGPASCEVAARQGPGSVARKVYRI